MRETTLNEHHPLKTGVLAWDRNIFADHTGVTAKNGIVTLSGHVETYLQKMAADTAAGLALGDLRPPGKRRARF